MSNANLRGQKAEAVMMAAHVVSLVSVFILSMAMEKGVVVGLLAVLTLNMALTCVISGINYILMGFLARDEALLAALQQTYKNTETLGDMISSCNDQLVSLNDELLHLRRELNVKSKM